MGNFITQPTDVYSIATGSSQFWSRRDEKITKYRDLVRQLDVKQRAKTGRYHRFEGNESGTFFSTMVQLLSKFAVKLSIPLTTETKEERETAGSVERLVQSALRDVDFRRAQRMDSGKLQTSIAQYECSDGWICMEVVKHAASKKKPLVDIRAYDTLDVHPHWGPDGLASVVVETRRTPLQVGLEYPDLDMKQKFIFTGNGSAKGHYNRWSDRDDTPVYSTYWMDDDKVMYAVMCNSQWAVEPVELKWCDRIPLAILPINGLPFRTTRRGTTSTEESQVLRDADADDWTLHVGRGIFFMNEHLYAEFNELWATILDTIDQEGRSTYSKMTEEGDDDELTIGRGADAVNPLKVGEKIERIPPPQISSGVGEMLSAMSGMLQRGGVSWQLMGQAQGNMTGFAIAQLLSAALYIATPYKEGMEMAYVQLADLITQAYASLSGKTKIRAYKNNTFVEEDFDPIILKGKKFFFEAELRPGLPDHIAERINLARSAKADGLLDDLTILDEILQVDDPELVLARKDEQEVMNLPRVKLRRMAAIMIEQGDVAGAAAVLMELMMIDKAYAAQAGTLDMQVMQLQQVLGQQRGPDISMETGEGGAGPGGGAPEAANPFLASGPEGAGLPPEVLPPEMQGISRDGAAQLAGNFMQGMGRF